jgi:type II secretion system protein G
MNRRNVCTMMGLALALCAAGGCDNVDLSTPKAAAKALMTAFKNGNASAAKAAANATTDKEKDAVAAAVELAQAGLKLERAMRAQFEEARKKKDPDAEFGEMLKGIDTAEVKIEGDTATLKGERYFKLDFKKVNGKWKVEMPKQVDDPDQLRKVAKAMDQVAADVKGGKYKTFGEAEDAAWKARSNERRTKAAFTTAAKTEIMIIKTALDTFEVDQGRYPTNEENLNALVVAPAGVKDWRGPYLEKLPTDPWGHAYVYRMPGEHNKAGFDLSSMGPDGKVGGGDDIDNWSEK